MKKAENKPAPQPDLNPDAERLKAERLAILGQVASGLSGELRQPLSVIRNAVYFLNIQLGTAADEKVRRHLGILLNEVETLTRIVANIASLASTQAPKREVSDLEVIVAVAVERTTRPEHIKIERTIAPHTTLFCDPDQLRQAITNIITNSIQAMPDPGTIKVTCRQTNEELRIEISDTGTGMKDEIRNRVFEPLFTTSPQRTGLGMTVARSLIGANGGTVEIESEPGKGTTVALRFLKH